MALERIGDALIDLGAVSLVVFAAERASGAGDAELRIHLASGGSETLRGRSAERAWKEIRSRSGAEGSISPGDAHPGVEEEPVVRALVAFVERSRRWTGSAQDLLKLLLEDRAAGPEGGDWPRTPRGMSGLLRRHHRDLARRGVVMRFHRRHADARLMDLIWVGADMA